MLAAAGSRGLWWCTGWGGCRESPHASQSCLQPTMGCTKTTMGKTALCTKNYLLNTKTLSNQRPTVPLPKYGSERNRQLLEAGNKMLGVGDSLHQNRVPTPLRGCGPWTTHAGARTRLRVLQPISVPGRNRDTEEKGSRNR